MSFISSVAEFLTGKKQEASITPPAQTIDQKRHELDSLQRIMSSPAGKDFRSPQTDAQDANRIKELQGQISAMKPQETVTPLQPTPEQQPGITQIPVAPPEQLPAAEEPKVA